MCLRIVNPIMFQFIQTLQFLSVSRMEAEYILGLDSAAGCSASLFLRCNCVNVPSHCGMQAHDSCLHRLFSLDLVLT